MIMKFNTKAPRKVSKVTTNGAGGRAYTLSAKLGLLLFVISNFLTDTAYRTGAKSYEKLKTLINACEPIFVAKLAIYTRTVLGMRSITHAMAVINAPRISGTIATTFYFRIAYRVDDMTEILALFLSNPENKIPNSLKKGFALAFEKFTPYQLAKYRGEGNSVKLVDVVNLCHPNPLNVAGLNELVNGTLKNEDTWEAKLSASKDKHAAWKELLESNKLGYLALLRNLRNICEFPDLIAEACFQLTNVSKIKSSLVFPYQFFTAWKLFSENTNSHRFIRQALEKAFIASCANVVEMGWQGRTLVVVDNSGSMDVFVGGSKTTKCNEAGALFGITLAKAINADLMEFGSTARYVGYSLSENGLQFASEFKSKNKVGHSTNFGSIFTEATLGYDRIIIFSDMQSWVGVTQKAWADYKRRNLAVKSVTPRLYCWDLASTTTSQFPENEVTLLGGFSDKFFSFIPFLEKDKDSIFQAIEAIDLDPKVMSGR